MRKNILLLMVVLFYIPLGAQIVNIEDRYQAQDTVPIRLSQLDLNAKWTKNNSHVVNVAGKLRTDWLRPQANILLTGGYNILRSSDQKILNKGFAHLRYVLKQNKRWAWETFGQLQYNEQLLLRLRGLLGVGGKYTLINQEDKKIMIGVAYMREYNEIDIESTIRRDNRVSSYFSIKYIPANNLMLSNTSYYQPLIGTWGSSRLSSVSTLVFKLNKRLSLSSNFSLTYDGVLANLSNQIPFTYYTWTNGLRINW